MASRGEINGANSRKHGLSRAPLYELCRSTKRQLIARGDGHLLIPEWREGRDAVRMYEYVRWQMPRRPSRRHILALQIDDMPGFGWMPGNLCWCERSPEEMERTETKATRRRRLAVHAECECPDVAMACCPCDWAVSERERLLDVLDEPEPYDDRVYW